MSERDNVLAQLMAKKAIIKRFDTIGMDYEGKPIKKWNYIVCDEAGKPSNSVIIEWELVKEYEHFNLWRTLNSYEDMWTGIGNPIDPKNCIPHKRPYCECFYKEVDPNEKLYYRKSSNNRELVSLKEMVLHNDRSTVRGLYTYG